MKRRSIIVLALSLSILAGLTFATLRSLFATQRVTFAFVVPKAISHKLPACIPSPADCQWKLWRTQRQAVTSTWMSWDLYAQYRGQVYHAHGYRTGDATRWLWVIDGHEYWLKAIRVYADANPSKITQGPALLENVRKNQSICDVIAPLIFINISNDAGQLVQPNPTRHSCNSPTDGGVQGDCTITQTLWPDGGAVANCAGSYWLARCKFGGSAPSSQIDEDAGFGTDSSSSTGSVSGILEGVDDNQWIAPDAAVSHQCTLPAGTPCP